MYKILIFLAFILSGSCANKAEKLLEQKKYAFTNEEFLRATIEGDVEAVQLFLKAGMTPEVKNSLEETPLIMASKFNRKEIVSLLIKADSFLENRDVEGMTALCWAARRGNTEIATMLIDAGSFVDTPDSRYGVTPLMFASFEAHLFTVKMLANKGADINHRNNDGGTALMNASYSGNADIVDQLLLLGADPNLQVYNGFTALMYAVQGNNEDAIKSLRTFKADISLKDEEGKTAADMARESGYTHLLPFLE